MLEKSLNEFIDKLYINQNIGAGELQKDLFSKKEFYETLSPVINVLKNRNITINEARKELFNMSNIESAIHDFICNRGMAPGLVLTYGTMNYKETIVIGNMQEVKVDNNKIIKDIEEMNEDTIFDLASITKLFTTLSILKLVEKGLIKLEDEVVKYCPQFKNIKSVKIYDLISFNIPVKTSKRIDEASSFEEAEKLLFDVSIDEENKDFRPYTDMGAMVLKYVIESVSKKKYYNFIYDEFMKKNNLKEIYASVPKDKIYRTVNTGCDGRYYNDGTFKILTNTTKGVAYDPKSQKFGQVNGNLSGHAGLFSTSEEMANFARALISGKIIDKKYLSMISKNRTGKVLGIDENGNKKYKQFLGFLCYSKNPSDGTTELSHKLSGSSFASAGWTGTHLTIDPINEVFLFLGSNRSHNRMTLIEDEQVSKIKIDKLGKKTIKLPNGQTMIDSRRFAWERGLPIVQPAISLVLQYKFLEEYFNDYTKHSVVKYI